MLRTLSTIRRPDAVDCGSKAACLGELASRGYTVPGCAVLPVSIYEGFLVEHALAAVAAERARESVGAAPARLVEIEQEMSSAFARVELSPAVAAEILQWVRVSGANQCAVRSSATNEDLAGASFAGQYSSFLNVRPSDVPRTIVSCFASLFNARAAFYRRRKRMTTIGAMAVIVQKMVPSDHAGVVFTRAPRRPETLLIECAAGLGDEVVSGTVAPNRYYLNRSTLHIEEACERQPLAVARVQAVAREALAIEADLGGAQDVEFGLVHDQVHILQARPAYA